MNKKIMTMALVALSLASTTQPFFGMGFSVGGHRRCHEPRMHFGMGVPLNDCGPTFGFGFDVPLRRRCPRHVAVHEVVQQPRTVVVERIVRRPIERQVVVERVTHVDDEDKTYWEIYNDSPRSIKVTNCDGRRIIIRPYRSGQLNHENGFDIKVEFTNDSNIYAQVERNGHYLTVQDHGGVLVHQE
jgi:hypothetical protein